jgi:hypothetical protein
MNSAMDPKDSKPVLRDQIPTIGDQACAHDAFRPTPQKQCKNACKACRKQTDQPSTAEVLLPDQLLEPHEGNV